MMNEKLIDRVLFHDIHPYYGRRIQQKKGFEKLLLKIFPLYILLPLKNECNLAWIRLKSWRVLKKYKSLSNQLINIGCGNRGKPGWINVDVYSAEEVNCIFDCRKYLPFPDNSAKGIFIEHFFEHLDYTEEVPLFLSECYRILSLGGVMRIIIPDAEKYLMAYCMSGWEEIRKIRGLDSRNFDNYTRCIYNTKMEVINEIFRQEYTHKFAYDYETIEGILYKYGFSQVTRQEFRKSLMPDLCIDHESRVHESLYVDALK